MTARELYEFALIEVNKLHAPSLLLEDYNYFINKAVQQYINLAYNKFDINQQANDDLRVLTSTKEYKSVTKNLVQLPEDYVHLLNCIVTVSKENISKNCGSTSSASYTSAAKRLTSDTYAGILNNYYLKPSVKRPYYILKAGNYAPVPLDVETKKAANSMDANVILPELQIECGNGVVTSISIDYVRAPRHIVLTYEQVYSEEDNSQILEFPDYICFEIINIFTKLLMENASDPRLQTNLAVNQTIAGPSASMT